MFSRIQTILSGPAGYLMLLLSATIVAVTLKLQAAPDPDPRLQRPPAIAAVSAEPVTQLQVLLLAEVVVDHPTLLNAGISAEVKQVHVQVGQHVEAGQILAQLDDRDASADLRSKTAELERLKLQDQALGADLHNAEKLLRQLQDLQVLAQKQKNRNENLYRKKTLSAASLDEARQQVLTAKAEVTRQEQTLSGLQHQRSQLQQELAQAQAALEMSQTYHEKTQVIAPAAGEITSIQMAAGEFVSNGTPLITLEAYNSVEFKAPIPRRWVALIQELPQQAQAQVYLDYRGQRLALKRVTGSVDPKSGQFYAYFASPKRSHLAVGQIFNTELKIPTSQHWMRLPRTVLQPGSRLFTIDDAVLEQQYPEFFLAGEWLILTEPGAYAGRLWLKGYLPGGYSGLKVRLTEANDV